MWYLEVLVLEVPYAQFTFIQGAIFFQSFGFNTSLEWYSNKSKIENAS